VKSQLEFISQVRKDLNRDGLLFNDICHRIFDYLVDSYSSRDELIGVMGDAKALEEALNGSRLKPMVLAAPPLEWAYIASVFRAISQRSSDHCSREDRNDPRFRRIDSPYVFPVDTSS
jgi:hypothetical protein